MTGEWDLGVASKGEDSRAGHRERRDLDVGLLRADALAVRRVVWVGVGAGFVWGAVIGGLGGRMAMFLLRLTSNSGVRFFETDDGFGIGSFTFDTIFLVIFTAVVGVVGGVAYVAVRRWLPTKGRALMTGVVAGVVGGALFVEPGGVDFTLLDPLWLAVALFVVLPGLYGFAVSRSVERLIADQSALGGLSRWRVVSVMGTFGVIGFGLRVVRRYPRLKQWWRSETVTWVGRLALVAVTVLAVVQLVSDAIKILG